MDQARIQQIKSKLQSKQNQWLRERQAEMDREQVMNALQTGESEGWGGGSGCFRTGGGC